MLLYDLKPNFSRMNPVEQGQFIAAYRQRRYNELGAAPAAKGSRAKKASFGLSETEKALIKKLGLRQKDILTLRN